MTVNDDERTPLLRRTDEEHGRHEQQEVKETPIPWGQFSITLFLQLAEPMSSQVIYPFVPQLVRETGVTKGDDKKVAYYVGIMQSIFFATQALTVLHWSRISDSVGRKPVILIGLVGLSISMFSFGLARTFPALVIARSLNGALNGNIGVIKSMMGELTDATNVARAFAYQPISWSTGATIGPLIGGALSHPTERFPTLFGGNKFLEDHPYFLPCSIPATFTILAWLITLLFLKETNQTGFTFRKALERLRSRVFFSRRRSSSTSNSLKLDPGLDPNIETIPAAPPLRSLLTRPVILSTTAYALLSLLDIAYRAIQPTFYASPRSLGGLGLPPHTIGTFLAFLGLANGIFQVGFFARLTKRWGNKKVYLFGVASAAPIFALFPLMSAVVHAEDRAQASGGTLSGEPERDLSPILVALVTLQLALTLLLNMCYGSVFIFITAAASAISFKSQRVSGDEITYPHPRPTISSSSSSTTLIPSSAQSIKGDVPSRVSAPVLEPRETKKIPRIGGERERKKAKAKGGKKTLGAVNGLAQCTVSIMRCVGPYTASALYAKGLAWQYGKDAGSNLPSDGGPVSDPMPEGAGVNAFVLNPSGAPRMSTMVHNSTIVWRQLGGLVVYAVLIALVGVTLVVGSRLPEVPWSPAEDDEDDGKDDGGSEDEHEDGEEVEDI